MDEIYIQQVYQLAEESTAKGFDPFGAILVHDGNIVANTADRCIQYSDPTAHPPHIRAPHPACFLHFTLACQSFMPLT